MSSAARGCPGSIGSPESGDGGIAVLWPDEVTQTGGTVTISTDEPVVVGAPLRGQGWIVENGCCTLNAHRNVLLPVGGRINGAERFAIDVSRIDVAATREHGYEPGVEVDGDPAQNENYLAYGAPVLAVADATVVAVHASVPDTPEESNDPYRGAETVAMIEKCPFSSSST